MEHAQQISFDDQRHPEQRVNPLLAQDRIHDVGVIDVGDEDRHSFLGDPSCEALADGDANALLHFLFDPLGRSGHQLPGLTVEQQDRRGVDGKQITDAHQELVEQPIELQLGEGRIAQPVEVTDLLGRGGDRLIHLQHDLSGALLPGLALLGHISRATVGGDLTDAARPIHLRVQLAAEGLIIRASTSAARAAACPGTP